VARNSRQPDAARRAFLECRLRNTLSLSKAADALGVSRRMVAYYSNGEECPSRPAGLSGREVSDGLHPAA
jgi:DNA-binding transcriptional regulator YiaG